MEQRRSGHDVAVWALTILLAGLFLVTGVAKLVGARTFHLLRELLIRERSPGRR